MSELVERVDERDEVLGVVDRDEAVRHGWLHRVVTIVCRDTTGRILVHRRPDDVSRFPGLYNWLLGGAVKVGEPYQDAAAREFKEEVGLPGQPRFVFKFLCPGVVCPYWNAVHEIVVDQPVRPDPAEIAWYAWLTEAELADLARQEAFVSDGRDALTRYLARSIPT
ncbi:NUDIX hydrolase [Streptomyces aquilus]|uniref:NUDIX hydrolase n=1 Tax=Streptomyces aquilus TaxID=2548456 RepID=UPI001050854B